MLKKKICQKCYQRHESCWTKETEESWEDNEIQCPPDAMLGKRPDIQAPHESRARKMLAAIFGSLLPTKKKPPEWCEYAEEHERK